VIDLPLRMLRRQGAVVGTPVLMSSKRDVKRRQECLRHATVVSLQFILRARFVWHTV
jgi:hypothetical protein